MVHLPNDGGSLAHHQAYLVVTSLSDRKQFEVTDRREARLGLAAARVMRRK